MLGRIWRLKNVTIRERVGREAAAHTEEDVLAESKKVKDRFHHVYSYPSRERLRAVIERITEQGLGRLILDYGCGLGEASLEFLEKGWITYGIDISPRYVARATRSAQESGYPDGRYRFLVMDAHSIAFGTETFDLVVGRGILHHLEAGTALREIHRILKPGGRVLLLEPLADSPLLRLFRQLTPKARTNDERPLSGSDLRKLLSNRCWEVHLEYCGLINAPLAVLTSMLIPGNPSNAILAAADKVEAWTHKKGILRSWNQYVLIDMIKMAS